MKTKSLNPPRIVLRTDQPKKDGRCTILLRVVIHGFKKDFSTKAYCLPEHFDLKKSRIKSTCPDSENGNLLISSCFNLANEIIFNALVHRRPLTIKEFTDKYTVKYPEAETNNDFLEFVKTEIELEKNKALKATTTVKKYGYQLNKLTKYCSKISFTDLTENFLVDFTHYMMHTLGNQRAAANNTLKFIRKFNNVAVKKGITTHYAFKHYQIKEEAKHQIKYVAANELKRMKEYYNTLTPNHRHYRPLKSFFFSCYTGLRYGDNKKFKLSDVVDGNINVQTEKTGAVVIVPLLSQAKELLNYSLASNLPNLNTPADQVCNRALKEVAKLCGINKPLTTHYARHTFASIALNNGVSKSVVQSILGHSTSKQTDLYAKLFDTTKAAEMAKLEGKY